jgi:NAD(P)H-quinone oxidoreductase subunit 4L
MQLRTAFSVLSLALISRLLVFAFGLLAVVSVGFENGQRPTPPLSDSALLDLPARWDSGWYVGLASGHYRWDGQAGRFENVAFFPAYPAIVSAVANTLGAESPLAWDWVAVGTSTTLFAVSLVLLTALATRIVGADSASHSALLCACYPFSIFFGLPYSESTYLCAVVAAFLMLEQRAYAATINLVAFNHFLNRDGLLGQGFAVFVIALAAAEAVVGLALILSIHRNLGSSNVENMNILKG